LELYIHSHIFRLHGVVLNQLNTGQLYLHLCPHLCAHVSYGAGQFLLLCRECNCYESETPDDDQCWSKHVVCIHQLNFRRITTGTNSMQRDAAINYYESKAIPVTGCGGLYGCEMLKIPHCLNNLLTNGGKVARPTHWPRCIPQKHYFAASGTHFC
jgi:hypothetical protein